MPLKHCKDVRTVICRFLSSVLCLVSCPDSCLVNRAAFFTFQLLTVVPVLLVIFWLLLFQSFLLTTAFVTAMRKFFMLSNSDPPYCNALGQM